MLHIILVTFILISIAQRLWYFQIFEKQITEIHINLIMKEFMFSDIFFLEGTILMLLNSQW